MGTGLLIKLLYVDSMKPFIKATLLFLSVCLSAIFIFLIDENGHMYGKNEHYDFIAGPLLTLFYGLGNRPLFVIFSIIGSAFFILFANSYFTKLGKLKYLSLFMAFFAWIVSGASVLAVSYGA